MKQSKMETTWFFFKEEQVGLKTQIVTLISLIDILRQYCDKAGSGTVSDLYKVDDIKWQVYHLYFKTNCNKMSYLI